MSNEATKEGQVFVPGYRVADLRGRLPARQGATGYDTRPLTAITMAVVHYSGVDADSPAQAIAEYQTGKAEGDLFPAIAYHFVVRQSGEIEQCHDLITRTWHAGALGNDRGIAICLPMLAGPTPLQAEATARLILALGDRLKRTLQVKGHKELGPTQCPGEGWQTWKHRLTRPSGGAPREIVVGGIPIRWAFFDCYRRLEALKPGLCGSPLGPHRPQADGSALQVFAGCQMRWQGGQMWVCFEAPKLGTGEGR
jgi:hypothetical protein